MVRRKRRTLVIRDAETVRALRTPLRQEILGVLERLGGGSVKEVASEVGRDPASLYYHIHELVGAGLLVEAGKRAAGRGTETVYEPAAERIIIDRKERSRPFTAALSDLHRAALRTAERELLAVFEPEKTEHAAPADSVTMLRLGSHLAAADAARAQEMLREVAEFVAEHDAPGAGDAYSLTAVFVKLPRAGE